MRNLRKNDGFTLIELMIVVVIIGILAAIAIPKFTQVSNGAKQAEAEPILKQICSLVEAEKLKSGSWAAVTLATLPGWDNTTVGKHFTAFDFDAAAGKATATAGTTGAKNAEMDCATKTIKVL